MAPIDDPQPAEAAGPRRLWPRVVLAACLTTFAVTGWIALGQLGDDPAIRTVDVPSYWDDVPLECRTTKVLLGGQDVEWFRCRDLTSLRPPPGRYRSPGTLWYSDVDGRPAVAHDIVISPAGTVTGWARYR